MKTPMAIKLIEKWSYDYIKMDCEGGRCYGVLAVCDSSLPLIGLELNAILVRSIEFVLLCHCSISFWAPCSLESKIRRTNAQLFRMGESFEKSLPNMINQSVVRWWGPKTLLWLLLVVISFFIPNGFFMFWGNYISLIGATVFILLGLVLLVDFAHSWAELCVENMENSEHSKLWGWLLIGSTVGMYAVTIALTGVLYAFFAGSDCTLNRFFITLNLILVVIITALCVHPSVQEYNPRSGIAQSSMVAVYCTYLIMSAVGNHSHAACNPLHGNKGTAEGTRTTTVILGAIFTFLAIAYSTSRAATQSRALVGNKKGAVSLPEDNGFGDHGLVTAQPSRTETPRYRALLAAVEAG